MMRKTLHYSGRVQGVGFRFTTERVARGHAVTGYVRNLPDGRVQCVVEGEQEEVERFSDELARRMRGYIREVEEQEAEGSGEFSDFRTRH